jgi:hypothetical protein
MHDLRSTGAAHGFTDAALMVAPTMPGPLLKNVDALLLGYRRGAKGMTELVQPRRMICAACRP